MLNTDNSTLIFTAGNETVHLEPWGRDGLRVRATMNREFAAVPQALLEQTEAATEIAISPQGGIIRNGMIEGRISAAGDISFYHTHTGTLLLAESEHRPMAATLYHRPRSYYPLAGDMARVEMRFAPQAGERLYGLGQHRHGFLDQKGCVIELQQRNAEVCIPFLVSSRHYGLLWNNPAIGRVELGKNGTCWVAEETRQIDYYITAGASYADILARYADATGHAPRLPAWAAGFWQSKCRYRSQEELLTIAHRYQELGLPLSVIVVDYFHWSRQGEWDWDHAQWPDPAGMVRELAAMGVKLMVSIWPSVNPDSPNAAEMGDAGLLTRTDRGLPVLLPFVDVGYPGRVYIYYYDATNPAARRYLWQRVNAHYVEAGVTTFWLDACEPEILPVDHRNVRFLAGSGLEVGNIYPLLHQQGFADGLREAGEHECVMLSRSAWAGSQRLGAAVWSGDIPSTFAMLRIQVRAGLNIAMSGIPWWTTDIGGFYGGHPDDPAFRELLVRWFQYGVFCPLCRLHGARDPFDFTLQTGPPNELWSYGEEVFTMLRALLLLRERLRPYLLAQMDIAHETGLPPMRPLFVDFEDDPRAAEVDDQFMLGPSLLIAPVLYEGARSRQVYLPAGAEWMNAWNGESYAGGQCIEVAAPLEQVPVFVRDREVRDRIFGIV